MAKNQLDAKLNLDAKGFTASLSSAAASTTAFKKQIETGRKAASDFAGGLGLSIGKFAGFAAAGVLAKEGLQKFIAAGQTTSDWVANNVNAWRATFDAFFESLNNGSVSGFLSNMAAIRDAAFQTSVAIDDLADAMATMGVINTKYRNERDRLMYQYKITKDKSLIPQIQALNEQQAADMNAVKNKSAAVINAVINEVAAKQGSRGARPSIDRYMEMVRTLDVVGGQMARDLKQYNNVVKQIRARERGGNGIGLQELRQGRANLAARFQKNYGIGIEYAVDWFEKGDEKRNQFRKQMQDYYNADSQIISFQMGTVRALKSALTEGTTGAGRAGVGKTTTATAAKNEPPEGSLAWFDKRIGDLKSQLSQVTDAKTYQALTTAIEELTHEAQLARVALTGRGTDIRVAPSVASTNLDTGRLSSVTLTPPTGVKGIAPADRYGRLRSLETQIGVMSSMLPEGDYATFDAQSKAVIDTYNRLKIEAADLRKELGLINEAAGDPFADFNKGMAGVTSLMGSLSKVLGDGADEWLAWGQNVLQTVATSLPAIAKLVTAMTAQSAAQTMAENAKLGPFGWISGIAAMASVLAALAALPKFATGGIVGGASFNGDHVHAMLNSGEMVINRSQQANLWRAINSGNLGGLPAEVTFHIDGDSLEGVLDNRKRRLSRLG